MKVKSESEVAQSCRTLRDPMDCSLPGSSIHGIFQARVLEWGAIAFSATHLYLVGYFTASLWGQLLERGAVCVCVCDSVVWKEEPCVCVCVTQLCGKRSRVCVCICVCHSVVSNSLLSCILPTRLLCLWNSPGKNTGVACHALLQGIFLTQGWNMVCIAGRFFTV